MRSMRLLSMMEVTSDGTFGLMTGGAAVKLRAQSIRSTGGSSMANGGVEILMKWCNSKIIYPCCISIGTKQMLSVDGRVVACQPRLNGRWRLVPSRLRMVAESPHTSDSFRGAMKLRRQNERIWNGVIWAAWM